MQLHEIDGSFSIHTDLSIALARISGLAAEKPPLSIDTGYIAVVILLIDQLAERYRKQRRFWEDLRTLVRKVGVPDAKKRSTIVTKARSVGLNEDIALDLFVRAQRDEECLASVTEPVTSQVREKEAYFNKISENFDTNADSRLLLAFVLEKKELHNDNEAWFWHFVYNELQARLAVQVAEDCIFRE